MTHHYVRTEECRKSKCKSPTPDNHPFQNEFYLVSLFSNHLIKHFAPHGFRNKRTLHISFLCMWMKMSVMKHSGFRFTSVKVLTTLAKFKICETFFDHDGINHGMKIMAMLKNSLIKSSLT